MGRDVSSPDQGFFQETWVEVSRRVSNTKYSAQGSRIPAARRTRGVRWAVYSAFNWCEKKGDFTPDAVMTSYKYLLDNHYPSNRVLLSPIKIPMRYAGPREAIFHALIRRNYGCTHFIVGRDHAGVGDFYGKYQAQDLIRTVEPELGIAIRYMCGPFYCAICQGIATEKTCQHLDSEPSAINEISGTWLRQVLLEEASVDANLVRQGVIESLKGIKVFLDENDEY